MREIGIPESAVEKLSDPAAADTTMLAYLGDAVYELYVRGLSVSRGQKKARDMNRSSVSVGKADSQAEAAKALMDLLTPEEQALMKRARNRTNTPTARGSTPKAYKLATGFEALVGWLYVTGESDRLNEVLEKAVSILSETKPETKNE